MWSPFPWTGQNLTFYVREYPTFVTQHYSDPAIARSLFIHNTPFILFLLFLFFFILRGWGKLFLGGGGIGLKFLFSHFFYIEMPPQSFIHKYRPRLIIWLLNHIYLKAIHFTTDLWNSYFRCYAHWPIRNSEMSPFTYP